MKALCQTLSKALCMFNTTAKDSLKSQKTEYQELKEKEKITNQSSSTETKHLIEIRDLRCLEILLNFKSFRENRGYINNTIIIWLTVCCLTVKLRESINSIFRRNYNVRLK